MSIQLPKIKRKKTNVSCPKRSEFLLTNTFSSKLQRYRELKQPQKSNQNIFENSNQESIFLTSPNIQPNFQTITEPSFSLNTDRQKEIEERNNRITNQKFLIKIYDSNYQTLMDRIRKEEEIPTNFNYNVNLSKSQNIKSKGGFNKFNKTIYSEQSCMHDFFNKYSQFNTIYRKYFLNNCTPSLAFIKSSNDAKIIPNPLGLLKRKGDDKTLEMNNQKVGDTYIKVLGNALKYSDNLTYLELSGNRISSIGINKLFSSINQNEELTSNIHSINLSENNIGSQDITEIINYIQNSKNNLENLDLFGNLMGDVNIKKISESFFKIKPYIKNSINLGKNNIHDISSNAICEMLNHCSSLRELILSHNWLHNKAASQIITQLSTHFELRILDLSWNVIGDDLVFLPSYEEIVNSEIKHPDKNFDNFSLNEALTSRQLKVRTNPLLPPIETNKNIKNKKDNVEVKKVELKKIPEKPKNPSIFAIALGEYFTKSDLSLIHLDISYNNLNSVDCKLLSEKVKTNHEILGIHVEGNEMEIDALGFITPLEKNIKNKGYFSNTHIFYGMNINNSLRKTTIDNVRKIRNKNQCWICSGFREVEFEYIPEEIFSDPVNHLVKIHLSFDNYKPFDMICDGTKYQIVRMCPPGEIKFFFSVDTIPVKKEAENGKNIFKNIDIESDFINYTFDKEYIDELKNIQDKLKYNKKEKNNENKLLNIDINNKINITVDTICKLEVKFNKNVISDDYRKLIQFSSPRPEKIIDKFVKPKTPWSFPISIWAYYGYDYNDVSKFYLDQCFKFDFDRCQFNKDFQEEESYEELKRFLRERYKDIIDCYKYYSSFSGYSTWQITQNNLTEFINKCNGLCDKTYDINNVFLTQKSVCGNLLDKEEKKNGNRYLSDNIVRHQFLNLLVKVSKDKYITILKVTKDPLEAVKMAFEKHYNYAIKGFEYHTWRQKRYYNERIDNFLKSFLPVFDAVYYSYAKQKGPRKKDVWMLLEEFNVLVQNIVDINEFPIREIPYIFNQSMNLQINEIYTDKHINMLLPQFLEAICRVIDKASPIPFGESKEDWPMNRRLEQPLINKLENILPNLIKLITHPEFKLLKEKFQVPSKDIITGLYTPNYDSPFYQGYIIKVEKKEEKKADVKKDVKENVENNKVEEKVENDKKENEKKNADIDIENKDNKDNSNDVNVTKVTEGIDNSGVDKSEGKIDDNNLNSNKLNDNGVNEEEKK